jgi:hypothetical protein
LSNTISVALITETFINQSKMKKLLLLFLGFPVLSFSQGLSISDNYSNTALVTDVLIGSSCIQVSNIQSQGDCGIAHFSTTNPDFAFEEGIIINTGIASELAGDEFSYTHSVCSNLGDADLQAIVQSLGLVNMIYDATYLKFDFIASADYFNFEFIFASNEYGVYQCYYGDTFAFLLTDLITGETQNLAMIPGTSTPISVVTVRNAMCNGSCVSVNPQYFDICNSSENQVALNMAGYTVPMVASASIIPNNPYSIKLVIGDYRDTDFNSAVLIKAGSFTTDCITDKIKMVSFLDENNNGVKEENEPYFHLGNFVHELNNSGEPSQVYTQNGQASIFALDYEDTHILSFQIDDEYQDYYTCSTTYSNIVVEVGSGQNEYYFPIVSTSTLTDVAVNIVPIAAPVPGFYYTNQIKYTNLGSDSTSGTITFAHSDNITFNNVSEMVTNISNGFTLDFNNLLPFETRTIDVVYSIPTIPIINLGDIVTSEVAITALNIDNISNNNFYVLNSAIVGSYDPNDITEIHGNEIVFDDFGADDYLYYTIRFQNTGTANTNFIRVINNLPEELDEESIRMVYSSHDYVLTKTGSNLEWFFEDTILLPQSEDDMASQGYIVYKIKPKAGYEVGTIIENQAEIYFDYNPAIITNTFVTEFIQTTMQTDIPENSLKLSLYPNPTQDNINISIANFSEPVSYTITDITGKTIKSGTFDQAENSVALGGLTLGLYFVKITSGYFTEFVKVIKN